MQLQGKTAIVSGAASGLGRATAERLAQEGARVALVDLNAGALDALAASLGAGAYACDVTDGPAWEAAFARITADLGAPSILVNCAGIAPGARIVGREGPASLAEFERVVRVNLTGTFNLMRLAAHAMTAHAPDAEGERGVIINTASVAAYEGQIGQGAYAASKGGVAALTLPAARELARYGIRVVAIAPGLFGTPMVEAMTEEVQQAVVANIPFPKRFGKPSEYAALVSSIIGNPMLNGSVLRLDAALRMQER